MQKAHDPEAKKPLQPTSDLLAKRPSEVTARKGMLASTEQFFWSEPSTGRVIQGDDAERLRIYQQKEYFVIAGQVKVPGLYHFNFQEPLTLRHVFQAAGGLTTNANWCLIKNF